MTAKWTKYMVAALLLLAVSVACEGLGGIGEQCHDSATGQVLEEVEDANGKTWTVKKMPGLPGMCGIPVQATTFTKEYAMGSNPSHQYVLHPDTGEQIDMLLLGRARGMTPLEGYEWY